MFVKNNKTILDCRVNILATENNNIYAYEIGIGSKDGKYAENSYLKMNFLHNHLLIAKNVINMLAIDMVSLDDPFPGRKALYTHIIPIRDLSKFLVQRKTNKNWRYQYYYKVLKIL